MRDARSVANLELNGLVSLAEKTGSLTGGVAQMRASAAVSRPGGAIMSLRGGMHSLIDALAQDLNQHIRLIVIYPS